MRSINCTKHQRSNEESCQVNSYAGEERQGSTETCVFFFYEREDQKLVEQEQGTIINCGDISKVMEKIDSESTESLMATSMNMMILRQLDAMNRSMERREYKERREKRKKRERRKRRRANGKAK